MDITQYLEKWHLPNTMIGRLMDNCSSTSSSMRVHIPVLMPNISGGSPRTVSVPLSKSCYCNDSSCMISVGGCISTQNYLTVQKYDNADFNYAYLPRGAELELDSMNGDEDSIKISNRRDPSYGPALKKCKYKCSCPHC